MTQKSKKSIDTEKENEEKVKQVTAKKKYEEENFVDASKPVWNYSILTQYG